MVSIVVGTFNHIEYIEKCLDSILMQKTNFPFQIILGEDESTDGTREICIEYAEKYPGKINLFLRSRKDVVYIKGNPTGRFNFIENLKVSKGKYIALCDGDDYWTDPLKLQKQVDFLETNEEYNICFHEVKIYDQTNHKLITDNITREVEETTDVTELVKGNYIHTPSVMLRNDFTMPVWFKESPIGDWILYMLAISNRKIKKLDEVMAVYRVHSTSIWSGLSQEIRNNKTEVSVKLLYDNVAFPKSIQQILKSRISNKKKKPTRMVTVLNRIKKFLK